jgi:hypothetical protein
VNSELGPPRVSIFIKPAEVSKSENPVGNGKSENLESSNASQRNEIKLDFKRNDTPKFEGSERITGKRRNPYLGTGGPQGRGKFSFIAQMNSFLKDFQQICSHF